MEYPRDCFTLCYWQPSQPGYIISTGTPAGVDTLSNLVVAHGVN